ncbi:putative Glucose-1-phosphate adenylyltransferase [Paratrimastix pyriformis]|uniref:glucose-1-phosphate adenylyltransferase n=1 Tax=Paratrimastix pyriformis TaxID=342808 RepID=A0ABQ8U9J9_9EUKA|nr:putative Glucose-1-phosphate adenylyltransferase [Paratrimastix pyriformis]
MEITGEDVAAVILGGGRGTRLFPLTVRRSKPAVPIAGRYRLIDVAISNCLNSGIRTIYVLTQYNSDSLHKHISQTYRFDQFNQGGVEILAAQQSYLGQTWDQGTADAVRQALRRRPDIVAGKKWVLILAGDHLYSMNLRELVRTHVAMSADCTLACTPVPASRASDFGIVNVQDGRVSAFVEKPKTTDPELAPFRMAVPLHLHRPSAPPAGLAGPGSSGSGAPEPLEYWASMGVYCFDADFLARCLTADEGIDFGKNIIPNLIAGGGARVLPPPPASPGTAQAEAAFFPRASSFSSIERVRGRDGAPAGPVVASFPFYGYWEDIGTIKSFFEANLSLTLPNPPFRFDEGRWRVFSEPDPCLPPARMGPGTRIEVGALLCNGSSVGSNTLLRHTLLGVRSQVGSNVELVDTIVMGCDYYAEASMRPADPVTTSADQHIFDAFLRDERLARERSVTPSTPPSTAGRASTMPPASAAQSPFSTAAAEPLVVGDTPPSPSPLPGFTAGTCTCAGTAGAAPSDDLPPLGIGSGSIIRSALIDKNARIGSGVRLVGVPPEAVATALPTLPSLVIATSASSGLTQPSSSAACSSPTGGLTPVPEDQQQVDQWVLSFDAPDYSFFVREGIVILPKGGSSDNCAPLVARLVMLIPASSQKTRHSPSCLVYALWVMSIARSCLFRGVIPNNSCIIAKVGCLREIAARGSNAATPQPTSDSTLPAHPPLPCHLMDEATTPTVSTPAIPPHRVSSFARF